MLGSLIFCLSVCLPACLPAHVAFPPFVFLFVTVLLWGLVALLVVSSRVTSWAGAKRLRCESNGSWRGSRAMRVICMVIMVARMASALRCDSVIPGLLVDTTTEITDSTCNEGATIICKGKP